MANKDVKQLIKKIKQQGFEVRTTTNNHHIVRKDGRFIASLPSTPGNPRILKNPIADLKRAGFRP
ncbi:hypothetical protein [Streptomyces sp. NPDC020667]|uniref:hypothetical protein n=1 Tax=Streptomyces sp. NPDC020667 TaxID=3154895 RepID=UPI0033F7B3ED